MSDSDTSKQTKTDSPRTQRLKRFAAAYREFGEALQALEEDDFSPDLFYGFGADLMRVAIAIQMQAVARGATPPVDDGDDDDEIDEETLEEALEEQKEEFARWDGAHPGASAERRQAAWEELVPDDDECGLGWHDEDEDDQAEEVA